MSHTWTLGMGTEPSLQSLTKNQQCSGQPNLRRDDVQGSGAVIKRSLLHNATRSHSFADGIYNNFSFQIGWN